MIDYVQKFAKRHGMDPRALRPVWEQAAKAVSKKESQAVGTRLFVLTVQEFKNRVAGKATGKPAAPPEEQPTELDQTKEESLTCARDVIFYLAECR